MDLDWSKQHCGLHQAPFSAIGELMPDVLPILVDFPDDKQMFTWDIKVMMLMPRQFPCIPGWHCDNVPRENGLQLFSKIDITKPMYLWISGPPLTQFKHGYVEPKKWIRFTQVDEHRGTMASDFSWRCFIRATHIDIQKPKSGDYLRRHSQVYLDVGSFQW